MSDPRHPETFTPRQINQAKEYTRKMNEKGRRVVRAEAVPNIFKQTETNLLSYTIDLKVSLELPGLLDQLPTKELYETRDIIDKILGGRKDARQ